ncbi:MAG: hypothetical protein ACRENE_16290, partial [Polyangiaceae bacterium]
MQHLENMAADVAAQHYATAQAESVVSSSRLQRSMTAMAALVAISVVLGVGVGVLLFATKSRRRHGLATRSRAVSDGQPVPRSAVARPDPSTSATPSSSRSTTSYLN